MSALLVQNKIRAQHFRPFKHNNRIIGRIFHFTSCSGSKVFKSTFTFFSRTRCARWSLPKYFTHNAKCQLSSEFPACMLISKTIESRMKCREFGWGIYIYMNSVLRILQPKLIRNRKREQKRSEEKLSHYLSRYNATACLAPVTISLVKFSIENCDPAWIKQMSNSHLWLFAVTHNQDWLPSNRIWDLWLFYNKRIS